MLVLRPSLITPLNLLVFLILLFLDDLTFEWFLIEAFSSYIISLGNLKSIFYIALFWFKIQPPPSYFEFNHDVCFEAILNLLILFFQPFRGLYTLFLISTFPNFLYSLTLSLYDEIGRHARLKTSSL